MKREDLRLTADAFSALWPFDDRIVSEDFRRRHLVLAGDAEVVGNELPHR